MNKTTKTLAISLIGAFALIYILMPKKKKSEALDTSAVKYAEPKVADDKLIKDKENAVIGIQAMRSAVDNNENKSSLDELSSIIFKDYGVKVILNKKTGLIKAMSREGKVLAEEEKS